MCRLPSRARKHLPWALLAGAALRLFFVWRFPAEGGDTSLYKQLAYNWLDHGIYGVTINGQVVPADLRVPGYPAFLAVVSSLFGRSQVAILLAQTVVDLGTCVLAALIAAELTPEKWRERVSIAALWLAATCPFVANYCATPLTEVLATFLTTAALSMLMNAGGESSGRRTGRWAWLLAGVLTGLGTLVRPETPLLLAAAALVLLVCWRSRTDWPKLLRAGLVLAAGVLMPLVPWAARNWITLHRVQFLATRYAELPGEFVPRGFYAWTKTWLWRYADAYTVIWAHDDGESISMDDIPPSAADTPEERARVASALQIYNDGGSDSPEVDEFFAQLAAERTSRHPLRTYVTVPARRVLAIWFTPRVELLPYSGKIWPLRREWEEDREDLCVSVGLWILNVGYVALALAGLFLWWRNKKSFAPEMKVGIALLVTFLVLRTAYLTTLETPEPRYVIMCYPVILVLGALLWIRRTKTNPGSFV